ncbi:MAG TPA: hypothetical protein VEX86_01785, partial [Longimicrobium sp.]|nr:hypothetical protein [Longimicrobium sp.]
MDSPAARTHARRTTSIPSVARARPVDGSDEINRSSTVHRPRGDQRPVNSAFRFSRNAVIPSRMSLVAA